MINILIAADYSPKDRVADLLNMDSYEEIFEQVKTYFDNADYSVVNLEAPIVSSPNAKPIKKAGPALKCSEKVIKSLKYLGVDCVTLANNHFRDYGEAGTLNTMKLCNEANINYVGAGRNLEDAKRILYKDICNKSFAIINCCEHEYSIASDDYAGSNPISPIQQYYSILEARKNADYVIVITHGGIEHHQLPSPRMVELYRFFIDAGADVVVNHHQHCYSGYEIYNGKPIFYGLGNFCFDWDGKRNSIWNEGFFVILEFDNSNISFNMIPYEQCNESPTIQIYKEERLSKFQHDLHKLNHIISNTVLLEKGHRRFLNQTNRLYKIIMPYSNKYLQILCRKGILPTFMPNSVLRSIHNKIMCESHLERLLYYFGQLE